MPPHKKSLLSFFYRLWVEKTLNTKAYSVSRSDSKTRGFFFFSQYLTIFPQHTSTETHSHTPAHAQFVVIKQLWQYIRYLFWLCFQYHLVMHLHTDTVILSLSVSIMPVSEAGCGSSTAPIGGGSMGMLLLKPHVLGAVILTFYSSSCLNSFWFLCG